MSELKSCLSPFTYIRSLLFCQYSKKKRFFRIFAFVISIFITLSVGCYWQKKEEAPTPIEAPAPAPAPAPEPMPTPIPAPEKPMPAAEKPMPEPVKLIKTPLFWNLWAQNNPYESLPKLEKTETYTIVLDLSAIKYPFKDITIKEPSKPLLDLLTKKLTSHDQITLSAFLLPDTKYFKNPGKSKQIQDLKIDVKKIREFKDPGIHWRDSSYVFGHVEFELQTKENAGSRLGLGCCRLV